MSDHRSGSGLSYRLTSFGRAAVLLEFTATSALAHPLMPAHLARAIRADSTAGDTEAPLDTGAPLDVVPTEDAVLIRFATPIEQSQVDRIHQSLKRVDEGWSPGDDALSEDAPASPSNVVVIPVVYNGADLAEVARSCAISVEQLIRMHSSAEFAVAFCGFSPGFAYLTGLPDALRIPRRQTPRTHVPAGAVAIAEHYCAVYPRQSPGGWHLIGHTNVDLFDPHRDQPALLTPGTGVRFDVTNDSLSITPRVTPPASSSPAASVRIEHAGTQCLIEDLGRPGWAHLAISESGAWDRRSHRLAQRLVGNDEHSAGIECLMGDLRLHALEAVTVAITGAAGPAWIIRNQESTAVATHTPLYLAAGDTLHVGRATTGLRRYVALRGGIIADSDFRSHATDTLSGLGPAPLAETALLHLGAARNPVPAIDTATADPVRIDADVIPTAHWSLLSPETQRHFAQGSYAVSPSSDRVGIRLTGPRVQWLPDAVFARSSRPVVTGAIQVPPDGQPIIFGPDHPATGGYPVIGVLAEPDLPAQWAPGVTIRLREVIPFLLAPRAASSTGRAADS
jgi:KipI family sensor histidine kinase inhibitor